MTHRSFSDVVVDEVIDCGTVPVTREDILAFGEEFDPLAIHVDPEAAAESPFGGLVASGIHTMALTQRQVVEHFYGDSDLIAAGHMEDLRMPEPVRPGDTLSVTLEIEDKRVSENSANRGVVTTRRTASVDGETVFSMQNHTVWER